MEYIWIGAHSPAKDDKFVWYATGQPLPGNYSLWAPGQPDYRGEGCVRMKGGSNFKLSDRQCTQDHSFICEL